MTQEKTLLDQLNEMMIGIEQGDLVPTLNEAYQMFLRSFLEIRKLQHQVKVLDDKLAALG